VVSARSSALSISKNGINLNFQKQLLTDDAWKALLEFAEYKQVKVKVKALLSGDIVNPTENRPALHSALREPLNDHLSSKEINHAVHLELDKLEAFVDSLRSGSMLGSTGKAFTDIVYLGVGGSNLGPEFVLSSLKEFESVTEQTPNLHFVSCMDGIQLMRALEDLDTETTLMVVCSKSFGTKDTLLNAETMLAWFEATLASKQAALDKHCIGLSCKPERMSDFGIPTEKQLLLWDWVGGRYSLWSVVGLPIALRLGMQSFRDLLAGAHAMDRHFYAEEISQNLPVILGLLSFWNTSMLDMGRNMVLPYDARLGMLADYLAQLHMESLGKSVTTELEFVEGKTGSMLWGGIGANSQHSFYQLLHQGTEGFYTDFILFEKEPDYPNFPQSVKASLQKQFRYSHANCLAQSELMAFGQDSDDPNKCYSGNHPSVTLLLEELNPYNLGQLIALYEHRTYVNAVLLDINAFDQYGVEQGKVMAEAYSKKLSAMDDYSAVLDKNI